MITYAVGTFVDKIPEMTMKDLINVKELDIYGMVLTGDGTISVYKLLFNFCGDILMDNERQIDDKVKKYTAGWKDRTGN